MLSSEVPTAEAPVITKLESPSPMALSAEPTLTLEKHVMAHEMLNDILETAMDIAESGEPTTYTQRKQLNAIDEDANEPGELKNIIYGLSKINVNSRTSSMPLPLPLDVEIKQMLGTMMAPAPEKPKHLGLGDSPPIDEEHPVVVVRPSKAVEKKTRITDLVMNSRKALTNMLNEEQRHKQDAWEENNEHVIQIIELQQDAPVVGQLSPEVVPLPYDEDEEELLVPQDVSQLESVDLSTEDAAAGTSVDGKGDEKKKLSKSSLGKRLSCCSGGGKRRKWLAGFKIFNFRRNRKCGKKEDNQAESTSAE